MDKSTEESTHQVSVVLWHNITLFVRPVIGNVALQYHYMLEQRVQGSEVYSGQIKL